MIRAFGNLARALSADGRSPADMFLYDFDFTARKINPQHKPSKSFTPSSMGCIRKMYYQMLGADVIDSGNSDHIGIFESGTDRHRRIQETILNMRMCGIDCDFLDIGTYILGDGFENLTIVRKKDYETTLHDKIRNITFSCDGIIKYNGELYILEIKTESSYKWKNRDFVSKEHSIQAATYSLEFNIDKILFIYENRDTCQKKAFIVNIKQSDKDAVVCMINECNRCVESRTPPDIPDNTKMCGYCGYRKFCEGDKCE